MAIPLAFALTMDVSSFTSGAKSALGAFQDMSAGIIKGLADLASRGSEVAAVENAFNRLATSAKQSGSDILAATRGASMGMISDFDAMAFANKGLLMGLPITAKDMATLAKTAITLGQAMKVGPAKAMEDLITGLGRGSPLILDNLGIVLSEADAYKKMAASIGKTTEELTKQEKTLAVYNAAMESAAKRVDEIGGIQMGVAQTVEQLKVAWENAYDAMGVAVAESELTPALQELGAALLENKGLLSDFATAAIVPMIDFATDLAKGLTVIVQMIGHYVDKLREFRAEVQGLASNPAIRAMLTHLGTGADFFLNPSGSAGMGGARNKVGVSTSTPDSQRPAPGPTPAELRARVAAAKAADKAIKDSYEEMVNAQILDAKVLSMHLRDQNELVEEAYKKMIDAQIADHKRLEEEIATSSAEESMMASMNEFAEMMDRHDFDVSAKKAAEGFGASFKTGLSGAMKGLPGVILGAIQGGGDIGKAIGAHLGGSIGTALETPIKNALSGVLGKTMSGALASLAGPLGSILGSLGGKLLGGLFGGGEGKKVNDMRDQFISAAGGLDALRLKAHAAGMTLEQLLRVSKVKDFEAAVLQLNNAFDGQAQAAAAVEDAMSRYGLTIGEMGPKFAQQKLDEQVGQLIRDYEVLRTSGADMNAVIEKMAPNINAYVQEVIAAGGAIPENMRAPLQSMLDMGLLTDAAGNKMESLEGLTFTESLTEGLTRAVDAIEKLVAGINQLLGIGPINIPVHVGGGGSSQGGGGHYEPGPSDQPEFAGGGVYKGPDGGPATLHHGEGIFTPEQMRALGGAAEPATVILKFDTPEFQRFVTASIATGHIKVH